MKIRVWLIGLVLVIIAAAGIWAASSQSVEVIEVKKGDLVQQVEETGYVQTVKEWDVEASESGRIVKIDVTSGDLVDKGQRLMTLENPELDAALNSWRIEQASVQAELKEALVALDKLQAGLVQAERELSRVQALYEQGAAAQTEYDRARENVENIKKDIEAGQTRIEGLRNQLAGLAETGRQLQERQGMLVVTSPIRGTVLDLPVEEGQVVAAGTKTAEIGSLENLEVRVEILSDDVGAVKVGQKAIVSAPVLGDRTVEGRVKKIYPRAYERTSSLGVVQRRVPVIVALSRPDVLRPGYEVLVSIQTLVKPGVLLLPRESVKAADNGEYQVMVVANGRIEYRTIKVGLKNPNYFEVVSGLKEGDLVVKDASQELAEGKRVKPVKV